MAQASERHSESSGPKFTPRLVAAKVPTLSTLKTKRVGQDDFDWSVEVAGKTLPMRGAGVFHFMHVDVYAAAFYIVESARTPDEVMESVPKALKLVYHYPVKKTDILRVADKNLRGNPTVDYKKIQRRLEKLNEFFIDVKDGDTYLMLYEPGVGTTFVFNGSKKLLVPGDDFAKAYFGIWISKYSVSQKFRKELLGMK